jgi:hypothetical protein
MRIYRVIPDIKRYQRLLPRDESALPKDLLIFDSYSKAKSWSPPEVYVPNPDVPRGDFMGFCAGASVCNKRVVDKIGGLLTWSGELLPIYLEGEELFVVNVTKCYNIMEEDEIRWKYDAQTGEKVGIERYGFLPNRMVETPIFKLPETATTEIISVAFMDSEETECVFQYSIEDNAFTGLLFEEIWRHDQ